jgi:serine protease Do
MRIFSEIKPKLLLFFTLIGLAFGVFFGVWLVGKSSFAEKPIDYSLAPETLSASFTEVAKRIEPAVVNIEAKKKGDEILIRGNNNQDELSDSLRRQQNRPNYEIGSGFVVEKDGLIITNFHVIEDSVKIFVKLQNGEEYIAKIVGTDKETDLAILKINAGKDLPMAKFGDSESVQIGDWVLAIGSPFGLAQTVTAGIISQTKRETPSSNFQKFIQTDAAVNRGNSGGPLVNMRSEVIGVNSQIATITGDYNGISFALPSNDAKYVLQEILANGKVRRGYLGVNSDSIKPEFSKVYGIPETKGAMITNVADKESPAGKAGLQINDVIISLNNQAILGSQDLIAKVALTEPEKDVPIIFYREINGKFIKQTTTAKLAERPSDNRIYDVDPPRKLNPSEYKPFGLSLIELTQTVAKNTNFEGQKGLLIKAIDTNSFIADVRNEDGSLAIRENDLIQRINLKPISDLKTFNEIAEKLKVGDAVVLHLASYNRKTQKIQTKIVSFTVQ